MKIMIFHHFRTSRMAEKLKTKPKTYKINSIIDNVEELRSSKIIEWECKMLQPLWETF